MKAARFFFRSRRRGMVLLELIVALTIFALVSLGLVTALDHAFGAASDRNVADEATRGLHNQLVLLHATLLAPGDQDLPEQNGIAYHLLVATEPTFDNKKQPILGLYRATITASWKDGGDVEKRSVSTLVFQP